MKQLTYPLLALTAILGLLTGLLISQSTENKTVLKVHQLEIVDQWGKLRAKIETEEETGKVSLRFYDEYGKIVWEVPPPARITPLSE